jgi:hypothetical protein
MAKKVNVGDVFLIPLAESCWAIGQILAAWNEELYVAIFGEKIHQPYPDPEIVIGLQPTFLVLTLDAKLWHEAWPVVGNVRENLSRFPQPAFKVRHKGVVYVESRDRKLSRPATASESQILRYRTVTSPAAIEEAVRAHFGNGDWNPRFESYLAEYAYKVSGVLSPR